MVDAPIARAASSARREASAERPPALTNGRAHEVCGPAARAFAAVQAGMRAGPLVWILAPDGSNPARGRPDPYGLAPFLDPGRLILVEPRREEDVYWAMEEALRSGAAPFVIAETPQRGRYAAADLTRSRRLQLAAEAGGGAGLLLIAEQAAGRSNAAETRWRAAPEPSYGVAPATRAAAREACWEASWQVSREASREASWEWRLLKNKRGPLGRWRLRWAGGRALEEGGPARCALIRSERIRDEQFSSLSNSPSCPSSRRQGAAHPLALAAEGGGGARSAA